MRANNAEAVRTDEVPDEGEASMVELSVERRDPAEKVMIGGT